LRIKSRSIEYLPLEFKEILYTETDTVLELHTLLRNILGQGRVESLDAFIDTLSPKTTSSVVPKVIEAVLDKRIIGAIVGVLLKNLEMGMILYSVVHPSARGRGIYTCLRTKLLDLLDMEANHKPAKANVKRLAGLKYIISELDKDTPLFRRYINEWKAFVAPIDYRQPSSQGLYTKEMALVFQPIASQSIPSPEAIRDIVSEIYSKVYRIPTVSQHTNLNPDTVSSKVQCISNYNTSTPHP